MVSVHILGVPIEMSLSGVCAHFRDAYRNGSHEVDLKKCLAKHAFFQRVLMECVLIMMVLQLHTVYN